MTEERYDSVLESIFPDKNIVYSTDEAGNIFGWLEVLSPEELRDISTRLSTAGARLGMITAYNEDKFSEGSDKELVYNFDLDGVTLTLLYHLTADNCRLPSLINDFPNADWHEREFAELYDIELSGRDVPKRLFLDPDIESGVFNRLIPLSSMMNGASTKQLWEKIFAETSMPDWAKEKM